MFGTLDQSYRFPGPGGGGGFPPGGRVGLPIRLL